MCSLLPLLLLEWKQRGRRRSCLAVIVLLCLPAWAHLIGLWEKVLPFLWWESFAVFIFFRGKRAGCWMKPRRKRGEFENKSYAFLEVSNFFQDLSTLVLLLLLFCDSHLCLFPFLLFSLLFPFHFLILFPSSSPPLPLFKIFSAFWVSHIYFSCVVWCGVLVTIF